MKTGKIKHITPKGTWSNSHGEFNKFRIDLADGTYYNFLAKGNFTKSENDEISFTVTNEEFKTAKLEMPKPTFQTKPSYNTSTTRSTNESILRQVAFKGAIELAAKGSIQLDEVEEFTNIFNEILNK
jgi:hypothetical protein